MKVSRVAVILTPQAVSCFNAPTVQTCPLSIGRFLAKKAEEGEMPDETIKRETMEEIEVETRLDLWKVCERTGSRSITVVQHVYVGQIDDPLPAYQSTRDRIWPTLPRMSLSCPSRMGSMVCRASTLIDIESRGDHTLWIYSLQAQQASSARTSPND
jgi:hypothetical protein